MKTVIGAWTLASLAVAGAAASGGAAAQQAGARTVQQDFDAAEALDAGTDKAAALAAWEALERRVAGKPRSRALVLVRKSGALLALDRRDDAVAAARAGLAGLPADDPSLRSDRVRAYLGLAGTAHLGLDYASAADLYAQAETHADTPSEKLSALRGLIQTATFVDPATAAAAATRADAVIAANSVDNALIAYFASAKAILAMNRGDLPRATADSMQAVKLLGGLTSSTDTRDVAARSNAAIALLLAGRKDDARRYMAMTGAGRLTTGNFNPGPMMTPPDCGGEAGLKPADMAVVQFSIGDDGNVLIAQPIYAAGGGKVALEFARTARGWSWSPEQVQEIPRFLRINARVELRCNLAFERPSISDALYADLAAWSATKGQPFPDAPEDAGRAFAAQRAAVASRQADTLATLPALAALLRSPLLSREERTPLARRALAIARASGAPATGLLYLELEVRNSETEDAWKPATFRRITIPLLTQAPYADSPQSRAALRLMMADRDGKGGKAAEALLNEVAGDSTLAANDPLKVGALIRLASLAQQRGDEAAARTAFARTGLSASQCALIDRPPTYLRSNGSFPQEAQAWGFEGWTTTQFDVAADGKVVGQRVIVSYPPFVFTKAGEDTIRSAVYTKSYRPDGGLGCGARTQNVNFRLPDRSH